MMRSFLDKLKVFVENKPRHTLYAILVLCFFIRVSYQVFYIKYYQFHDQYRGVGNPIIAYEYHSLARNLLKGRGYCTPELECPTARRGPVYPLFLCFIYWIFGINLKIALLCQAGFDTLTCLVIHRISLLVFRHRPAALLSSLIWAAYLPGTLFAGKLYSEPLFTLLLSLFVFFSVKSLKTPRTGYFIRSGVLLGLATLCRPVTQLFFIPAFLYYFLHFGRKKAFKGAALLFLSFALTLAPWTVRNYRLFRRFIPASTLFGYNLFIENATVLRKKDYLAPYDFEEYLELEKKIDREAGRPLNEAERGDIYAEVTLTAVRYHPFRYLVLCARRFTTLWFNLGMGGYGKLKDYLFFFINAPLMLLAMLAYLLFKGEWVRLSRPLLFLLFYNTLVHMLLTGNIRFAIPVTPLIIIPAGFAFINLWGLWQNRYGSSGS